MVCSVERDYILGEAIDSFKVNTIFRYILYGAIKVCLLGFIKIFFYAHPPNTRKNLIRLAK